MKKKYIFIGCFFGLLFLLWTIARITNIFQWYRAPSAAGEPTLKRGSHFFASKLKKPKRFDLICFYSNEPGMEKGIFVYRLCGIEGDLIEIKDGDLYVNKKMVDDQLNLIHQYLIASKDFSQISDLVPEQYAYPTSNGDSIFIKMSTDDINSKHIKAVRKNLLRNEPDKYIFEKFSRPWNQDHFGPITVPPESYFVLGDNRNEADDSRYRGFIPKENFVATVLWK
jgi:signal peptidase I